MRPPSKCSRGFVGNDKSFGERNARHKIAAAAQATMNPLHGKGLRQARRQRKSWPLFSRNPGVSHERLGLAGDEVFHGRLEGPVNTIEDKIIIRLIAPFL